MSNFWGAVHISSPQITSTSKTKYILKDKDLYLQEPNETLTRTK